jgi:uncharacterized membrane protein
MTSNEVRALGSPRTRRGLRSLFATLLLSLAVLAIAAMPAFAVASTSTTTTTSSTETGYSQKPKPPVEKEAKPEKETAPKKEAAAPKTEPEPAKEVAPEESEAPAKATELPFTGLDLRWVVGAGLLLIAAGGVSLRVLRRHERHDSGR